MAEREGFEPPRSVNPYSISNRAHSTRLCHLSATQKNSSIVPGTLFRAPHPRLPVGSCFLANPPGSKDLNSNPFRSYKLQKRFWPREPEAVHPCTSSKAQGSRTSWPPGISNLLACVPPVEAPRFQRVLAATLTGSERCPRCPRLCRPPRGWLLLESLLHNSISELFGGPPSSIADHSTEDM